LNSLGRGRLFDGIESLFTPRSPSVESRAIGAELELIPFDAETRRAVPIIGEFDSGSLRVMRDVACHAGWTEIPAGADPPSWALAGGGRVSFEPGGQIELSSAAAETASDLIRELRCTSQMLAGSFANSGIELETFGVDPYNDIADIELQLHRPRYELMTRYFDSIGPSGVRMMRQTASLQINVETGPHPLERWLLLNALAPYMTAIFANSPRYAGAATGHRSYRARLWRTLDPSRTGLPVDSANPVHRYLDFALSAGAMMRTGESYGSFADWIRDGSPTMEDWELHLTTLFPEVRPRRYFELRSADSVPSEILAAPIAFVAGLIYDAEAAGAATEIIGTADSRPLESAGREGLDDERIRNASLELIDVALTGCEAMGESYISGADTAVAAEYFDRYTRQGRSPGNDWS
jgi:glutamate--cysteine ligase